MMGHRARSSSNAGRSNCARRMARGAPRRARLLAASLTVVGQAPRSIPLKLHRVLGDEPDKLSSFFAEVRKVAQ